jgi:quinoprotein glucose dehydrogenase
VQSTKQGFIFVLNRLTGEPIFPIEERRAPASDVPGETAALTQPVEDTPPPTVDGRFPGISRLADLLSLGYCSRTYAGLRDLGRFTPPSLKGSISYPGTAGGVEWGGGAVDPASATYVVNSSNLVDVDTLIPRADYRAMLRAKRPARDLYPQIDAPYAVRQTEFLNPLGMPCWKPPYGTLSAYDLNSGALLWREPFGRVRKYGLNLPSAWGSPTIGGPIVTASGLIFIGASMDRRVRALDLRSGRVLWSFPLEAPAVSNPSTFVSEGRQFVVFTAGGNSLLDGHVSDEVVAFALPRRPSVTATALPSPPTP